jgi:hypothetical protein
MASSDDPILTVVVRVGTRGIPAFQLRKGEEGECHELKPQVVICCGLSSDRRGQDDPSHHRGIASDSG